MSSFVLFVKSLRERRDENIRKVESLASLLNLLLLLSGLLMNMSAVYFISKDFWLKVQYQLADLKFGLLLLISFYTLILPVFGCATHNIVEKRHVSNFTIVFWAVMTFMVMGLPLIAEGLVFFKVDNILDYHRFLEMC